MKEKGKNMAKTVSPDVVSLVKNRTMLPFNPTPSHSIYHAHFVIIRLSRHSWLLYEMKFKISMHWERGITKVAITIKWRALDRAHLAHRVMSCIFPFFCKDSYFFGECLENWIGVRSIFTSYGSAFNYQEKFMHWSLRLLLIIPIFFCVWYRCCNFPLLDSKVIPPVLLQGLSVFRSFY